MKKLLLAAALTGSMLALTGCPDPAGDYADGMIKTKKRAEKLKVDVETKQIISMFEATEGRKPKTLDELKKVVGELPVPPAGTAWSLTAEGELVPVDVITPAPAPAGGGGGGN